MKPVLKLMDSWTNEEISVLMYWNTRTKKYRVVTRLFLNNVYIGSREYQTKTAAMENVWRRLEIG